MAAQLGGGERFFAYVPRCETIVETPIACRRLRIADLRHNLSNARFIDLVVKLRHRLLARFLSKTYIPTVRESVIVKSTLLLVHVNADVVNEAVRGAAGIRWTHPRCVRSEERVHLRKRSAPVSIEIDELDIIEYTLTPEDVHVQITGDCVLTLVVRLAGFQHESVELVDTEVLALKYILREASLEELAA